jgi:hypothetical protein
METTKSTNMSKTGIIFNAENPEPVKTGSEAVVLTLAPPVFCEVDEEVELGRRLDATGEEDVRCKVVAELDAPAWMPETRPGLLPEEPYPVPLELLSLVPV